MKKQLRFKEKWNMKDETCPHCGNVTKSVKGLTRQNIGKLFRLKLSDFIMLFIILMVLVLAWSYNAETTNCKEMVKNLDIICLQRLDKSFNFSINELGPGDVDINVKDLNVNDG